MVTRSTKKLEENLDDKNWIKNWYGKVTVVSFVEYSTFIISVIWIIYNM